jgi:hypothetical protein
MRPYGAARMHANALIHAALRMLQRARQVCACARCELPLCSNAITPRGAAFKMSQPAADSPAPHAGRFPDLRVILLWLREEPGLAVWCAHIADLCESLLRRSLHSRCAPVPQLFATCA